ncbi:MAG: peptidylprolyl isomerase [Candidatus Obscuribacterales bacterium]|nr:peptidylprolyl isomerase [Candidatus Obscuribacterales bacterium]
MTQPEKSIKVTLTAAFLLAAMGLSAEARHSEKAEPDPVVVVETNKGPFKMIVFRNDMPNTAGAFLDIVKNGTYNGTTFHRYEPKFCIQGGDPTGTGHGGTGQKLPLEINKRIRHTEAGMIGMAHYPSDKDSGSSQFYIILGPQSGLDNDYAVFAKVTEGLETVFTLRKGDTMDSVFLEGTKKESKKEAKKSAIPEKDAAEGKPKKEKDNAG